MGDGAGLEGGIVCCRINMARGAGKAGSECSIEVFVVRTGCKAGGGMAASAVQGGAPLGVGRSVEPVAVAAYVGAGLGALGVTKGFTVTLEDIDCLIGMVTGGVQSGTVHCCTVAVLTGSSGTVGDSSNMFR